MKQILRCLRYFDDNSDQEGRSSVYTRQERDRVGDHWRDEYIVDLSLNFIKEISTSN